MYNWDTLSARAQKLQQFQFSSGLQEQAIGQVVWVNEAGFLSVRQMLESEEKTKAYYQAPNVSSVANRLRHYVPPDEAAALIRANMPRRPKPGEIEETLEKAYDITAIQKAGTDSVPQHLPDLQLIEQIVAGRI
jgi:hypothetical protein